jgi:hypothetical protein
MEIMFRQVHPWAILPRKHKVNPKPKREEAQLMANHFAWVRASRSAELCWPWRMSQELGWIVESPVTITMDAFHDVEAVCPPSKLSYVSMIANASENWNFADANGKSERVHFTRNAGWTALYDFMVPGGGMERMFFINGQGSVEWVLGWEAIIPPTYSMLILPYGSIANLEVMMGVLDSRTLQKREGHTNGLAIPIRPTGKVTLQRGQPIARIVLLHADSLKARAASDAPLEPASAEADDSVGT